MRSRLPQGISAAFAVSLSVLGGFRLYDRFFVLTGRASRGSLQTGSMPYSRRVIPITAVVRQRIDALAAPGTILEVEIEIHFQNHKAS
jgi:hypothetical protein